jgi:hypothetical protein
MNPGDLVTISLGGYQDDIPGIEEDTGKTQWIARGAMAVYLGLQAGQQTLGGGARILCRGRVMLVQPGVIDLVQPTQGGV